MAGGINRRTVLASAALAAVVSLAFAVVLLQVDEMHQAEALARHSEQVIGSANYLERLVIDLETSLRGFALTGDERFLDPSNKARQAFPDEAGRLQRLAAAHSAGQGVRAGQIEQAGNAYIQEYFLPTIAAVRRDLASLPVVSGLLVPSPQTAAVFAEGRRRVEDLRARFDAFGQAEGDLAAARNERSSRAAGRARAAAGGGVAASIVLVAVFAGYLKRAIVTPVRRAAAMAGRLAGGDLSVRMSETGSGEVGALERSFNTMASSLESSQGELRCLLDQQAGLRRVATLVARGAAPTEVFDAVVREAHRALAPGHTILVRYDTDGAFTVVAQHTDFTLHNALVGCQLPALAVGQRVPPEDQTIAGVVFRTGRAARGDLAHDAADTDSVVPWAPGIRCAVAAPILVEGRLWGAMVSAWSGPEPVTGDVDDRLGEFTQLIATAIANTESRAELAASRARVVAAGDETRRRIERDLHDGIQQRLVSIGLDLRGLEAALPPENDDLKEEVDRVQHALGGAIEEVRELSRGIHPGILARGGLAPALRTLARRSSVPVLLEIGLDGRLPEPVEVALYYVVSEALTNAAKHAQASEVRVGLQADDGFVWLSIGDDGIGGADPGRGSGLVGLRDRIEALGGTIDINSPIGTGTTYFVKVPIQGSRAG